MPKTSSLLTGQPDTMQQVHGAVVRSAATSQLPAKICICIQDRILTLSCYEIEIHLFLILGIQVGAIRRNITAHHRAVRRHHDSVALI